MTTFRLGYLLNTKRVERALGQVVAPLLVLRCCIILFLRCFCVPLVGRIGTVELRPYLINQTTALLPGERQCL